MNDKIIAEQTKSAALQSTIDTQGKLLAVAEGKVDKLIEVLSWYVTVETHISDVRALAPEVLALRQETWHKYIGEFMEEKVD